jgi:hypothetical protein
VRHLGYENFWNLLQTKPLQVSKVCIDYSKLIQQQQRTSPVLLLLRKEIKTMDLQPQSQNSTGEIQPADFTIQDLGPITRIGIETELSRYPIHNLAKKGRVDIQIVKKTPTGQIDLRWEVSYSERYGQARQLAYKLDTIVINRRIDEEGRPLPKLIKLGSLRDICRDLEIPEGGNHLKGVKKAILQNASSFITAKLTYKTNDGVRRKLEAGFTRYSVVFTGEELPDGREADAVYIILNDPYWEVLNNAPIRPLNYDYLKILPPAAQRLYEIISPRIFATLKNKNPLAKILYSDFCTFSALTRHFDYENFRVQMAKIHRFHFKSGYLIKAHYEQTQDGEGKLDWMMCYQPGPKARAEYHTFTKSKAPIIETTPELTANKEAEANPPQVDSISRQPRRPRQTRLHLQPEVNPELLVELTKRGIGEGGARRLLDKLPIDRPVLDLLEWGDREIANQPAGKIRNPAGFYIRLLEEYSAPPPTFESSSQKKARQEAELARQRAIKEQEDARFQQEQDLRARAEARLQALTREQYQALYAKVKDELFKQYPFMAQHPDSAIHDGAIRAGMMKELQQPMDLLVMPPEQKKLFQDLGLHSSEGVPQTTRGK